LVDATIPGRSSDRDQLTGEHRAGQKIGHLQSRDCAIARPPHLGKWIKQVRIGPTPSIGRLKIADMSSISIVGFGGMPPPRDAEPMSRCQSTEDAELQIIADVATNRFCTGFLATDRHQGHTGLSQYRKSAQSGA
jgi:hypothetical protein